jgi:hypothetical protein
MGVERRLILPLLDHHQRIGAEFHR